jgi:hypothetical protein
MMLVLRLCKKEVQSVCRQGKGRRNQIPMIKPLGFAMMNERKTVFNAGDLSDKSSVLLGVRRLTTLYAKTLCSSRIQTLFRNVSLCEL